MVLTCIDMLSHSEQHPIDLLGLRPKYLPVMTKVLLFEKAGFNGPGNRSNMTVKNVTIHSAMFYGRSRS